MRNEDWRVEVELDVDLFGHSLSERLRALDLDEEAKRRLGRQVLITRDESRLFLYTETGSEAAAAARVLQEIVDADGLAADISVDHSLVVRNYRIGHDIALRDSGGETSTEELRTALLNYRMLFEDLLTGYAAEPENQKETAVVA